MHCGSGVDLFAIANLHQRRARQLAADCFTCALHWLACLLIIPCALKTLEFLADRLFVASMLTILSAMVTLVSFRFRRRASLELEVLPLRHQVAVLHRQRRGVNREIRDLIRQTSVANPL